jgi:toxin-antitoxin system PIN domain toxin
MILVDVNILLYAENRQSMHHEKAREWWDTQLSGTDPVCLCWPVVSGFIRIATNARVFPRPRRLAEAVASVETWFAQPCVRLVRPTEGHWKIFKRLLEEGQAVGNLVSDAHLAAMAIEHGCEFCSSDADFGRFRGLRWKNPLR